MDWCVRLGANRLTTNVTRKAATAWLPFKIYPIAHPNHAP
jgi:hypothetical protein